MGLKMVLKVKYKSAHTVLQLKNEADIPLHNNYLDFY